MKHLIRGFAYTAMISLALVSASAGPASAGDDDAKLAEQMALHVYGQTLEELANDDGISVEREIGKLAGEAEATCKFLRMTVPVASTTAALRESDMAKEQYFLYLVSAQFKCGEYYGPVLKYGVEQKWS
ncbi:hypothetical protein [Nocardia sp. NPDC127526]|uniref:hypothetical protein n=1 Tax=Nocardia sp. NPDC127526 TaxID=3345393 RepID=UPI00363C34B8